MKASHRRTLALATRLGSLTVADVMREEGATMREAWRHLGEVTSAGLLERERDARTGVYRWKRKGS